MRHVDLRFREAGGAAKCRMLDKANRTTAWLLMLTEGQLVYLKAGDEHLAANPALTSMKGVRLTMPPMTTTGGRGHRLPQTPLGTTLMTCPLTRLCSPLHLATPSLQHLFGGRQDDVDQAYQIKEVNRRPPSIQLAPREVGDTGRKTNTS